MSIISVNCRSIVKVLLLALLPLFFVSTASAGEAQKLRGYIISVDKAAKTMVIQHKKKGEIPLKWNDDTKFRRGSIEDLAPGKGVRNIFREPDDGFIDIIRIDPKQDKPADLPAS